MARGISVRFESLDLWKKVMEYTFRSGSGKEVTTVHLDDFGLMVVRGASREAFAYANVVAIMISRRDHIFKTFLYPGNHKAVIIPSYSYSLEGKKTDQSKAYSLFIRVLHHHLKDKSQAVFKFGYPKESLWRRAGITALMAFLLSLAGSYAGFAFFDPYLQATAFGGLIFILIIALDAGKLPKPYKPTEIPLRYLP